MKWTTIVKEDDDGELIIELPEDLCSMMGWGPGTDVRWIDNNNGTYSLEELIKPVYTIYSKPNCPSCERAKTLLDINGLPYETKDASQTEIRDELLDLVPSARSVPQIFENDIYVGGYEELSKKLGD